MAINLFLVHIDEFSINKIESSSYITSIDKENLKQYHHPLTYQQKLVSAYLKNRYISSYFVNEFGKPLSLQSSFNISHSGNYVILIVNDGKESVGVDIEKIRDIKKDFSSFVCNEEEKSYIKNDKDFFAIWTNKESLLKCIGTGINKKLNEVNGLPLNDKRIYEDKDFYSRTMDYEDYVISITRDDKPIEEIKIIENKEIFA